MKSCSTCAAGILLLSTWLLLSGSRPAQAQERGLLRPGEVAVGTVTAASDNTPLELLMLEYLSRRLVGSPAAIREMPAAGTVQLAWQEPVDGQQLLLQQLLEQEEQRQQAIEAYRNARRTRLDNYYDWRISVIRGDGPHLPVRTPFSPADPKVAAALRHEPLAKQPSGPDAAETPADLPAGELLPPLPDQSTPETAPSNDAAPDAAANAVPQNASAEQKPPAVAPAGPNQAVDGNVPPAAGPDVAPATVQPRPESPPQVQAQAVGLANPRGNSQAGVPPERRLLADQVTVQPDKNVTVCVRLFEPAGVAGMVIELACNPEIVEPAGVTVPGNLLGSETVFDVRQLGPGRLRISFAQPTGLSQSGIAAWVRFRAKGRPGDVAAVQVTAHKTRDARSKPLPVTTENGEIRIVQHRNRGDANGDGRANVQDAAAALQMMRKTRPADTTLDFNGDGQITREDIRQLLLERLRNAN